MNQKSPLLKRSGRNISLPFFVSMYLTHKFEGTNGFSNYVLNLILDDLCKDQEFINEFPSELKSLGRAN